MNIDLGIKPYYSTARGDLYNADCLDILPKIPDKAVDLVLTDPPYGIGFSYDSGKEVATPEDYWKWFNPMYNHCNRVANKFLAISQATKYMKYFWQWYGDDIRIFIGCKNFVSLRKTFMNYAYDPWVFVIKQEVDIRKNNKPDRNLDWCLCDTASLRNPHNDERGHPCPKPLSMLKNIINNFTEENDLILEPFAGSGTTLLSAEHLNRRWIGIEISEKYCELSAKRIDNFIAQGKLF